jgi:hypothetical protein
MDQTDSAGIARRGAQARANLVAALRECAELADAVETFQGDELLEVRRPRIRLVAGLFPDIEGYALILDLVWREG